MYARFPRRGLVAVTLAVVLPAAWACGDDDPVDDHDEPPAFMELTVGGQTFRVDGFGSVLAGTVPSIQVGAGTPVTARFLADDGDVLNLSSAEYELIATSATPGVLGWTSTGTFSGTLTGVTAGTGIVEFQLWHVEEGHPDWGPHLVSFTVVVP